MEIRLKYMLGEYRTYVRSMTKRQVYRNLDINLDIIFLFNDYLMTSPRKQKIEKNEKSNKTKTAANSKKQQKTKPI